MKSKKTQTNGELKTTKKGKVHFMGIGGSGMAGVSELAKRMGWDVSGCDLEEETAYTKTIKRGHNKTHLQDIDYLVVSPAVYFQSFKHPEFLEGKKRGILMTWQAFLGKFLSQGKKVLCIAGTHGKSTTTAMTGKMLEDAGLDPIVVLGAQVPGWNGSVRFGKGSSLIIEADEFFNNFLNYRPEVILLNNIEYDHPDFFKDEKSMYDSYRKFILNLEGLKVLIANTDSDGVQKILKDLDLGNIKLIKFSPKKETMKINLKVPGKHNLANATTAFKIGELFGIGDKIIKNSLENFNGIGRRLELLGQNKLGALVFDDYAHHPTAVRETLDALRSKYKHEKIIAVYEPHSYSRTEALIKNYKDVFKSANEVIIAPIFKARDTGKFRVKESDLVQISGHKNIYFINSFSRISTKLRQSLKNGNIVIVMGAGYSYKLAREILNLK